MKWSGGFDLRAYRSAASWIGEAWVGGTRILHVPGNATREQALDEAEAEVRRGPHAVGPFYRPTGEVRAVAICAPFGREIEVAAWFPEKTPEAERRASFSSFVRWAVRQ